MRREPGVPGVKPLSRKRSMTIRWVFTFCVALAFVAAILGLLKFAAVPFLWIWGLLALLLVAMTAFLPSMRRTAVIWINLAAVAFAAALAEAYFWHAGQEVTIDEYQEPMYRYRQRDEQIGFAPVPGTVLRYRRVYRPTQEQLFDARYTIGANGLRVGGSGKFANGAGCIWIFGDSFTFGHGLNDEQTLPYRLQAGSKGRYRVQNLAFNGYGPHQMLASLQSGHAAKRVDCEPDLVIFPGVPDGARRAAGYATWDPHGPRYVLNGDGRAVFRGHFDTKTDLVGRFWDQLRKSRTWMTLVDKQLVLNRSQAELYGAIIEESRRLVSEKYPRARFVVLLWDETWYPITPLVVQDLRARNVPLVLISDVLKINDPKYRLHAHDTHPSALANERIADYLLPRLDCIPGCKDDVR